MILEVYIVISLQLIVLCGPPIGATIAIINDADENGYYLGGTAYQWADYSVYHSKVDNQRYGKCYGFPRRNIVAGMADPGISGSRSMECFITSAFLAYYISYMGDYY